MAGRPRGLQEHQRGQVFLPPRHRCGRAGIPPTRGDAATAYVYAVTLPLPEERRAAVFGGAAPAVHACRALYENGPPRGASAQRMESKTIYFMSARRAPRPPRPKKGRQNSEALLFFFIPLLRLLRLLGTQLRSHASSATLAVPWNRLHYSAKGPLHVAASGISRPWADRTGSTSAPSLRTAHRASRAQQMDV